MIRPAADISNERTKNIRNDPSEILVVWNKHSSQRVSERLFWMPIAYHTIFICRSGLLRAISKWKIRSTIVCKNVLENISWPISCNFAPIYPFLPPFPQFNVGYFGDPSSCNTEITFFNIHMGVGGGGRSVHISLKNWKTCFFQKFLHTIVWIYPELKTPVYWCCNDFGEFLNDFQWPD